MALGVHTGVWLVLKEDVGSIPTRRNFFLSFFDPFCTLSFSL